MRITCNRAGGFSFFGVRLTHGENIVDDAVWDDVKGKLNERFLAALLKPRNGQPAELEIYDDAGEQPQLTAKEKITLIERCGNIDDLAQFETGENRKTVLQAIERRMESLVDAEHVGAS